MPCPLEDDSKMNSTLLKDINPILVDEYEKTSRNESVLGFVRLTDAARILCIYIPKILQKYNKKVPNSAYIRSRVFTIIFTFRIWQWKLLRLSSREKILELLCFHCDDEADCVAISAIRALGVVGTFHLNNSKWYSKICEILIKKL
eukprot:UN25139